MMRTPWPILLMSRSLGPGGTERQLAGLALTLDRSLFAPHVACFNPGGMRDEELRRAGVPIVHIPVASLYGLSVLGGAVFAGRYLNQHGIRLVHTFDTPMNLFGVPVGRAFRTPIVLSSQRAYRSLTPSFGQRLLRLTDGIVDGIVVNCEAIRRHLEEDERVAGSRILVCYNGVDTEVFRPCPAASRPEALHETSLVIGAVCVMRREKDLPALMEAFARVRRNRAGLKLALVGSGPETEKLRMLGRRLEIEQDCVFAPDTERVTYWMRGIDIFVLPSRSEALSNSLMEAMACGCCAVASRVGGNPELVRHLETGILFKPGDVAELAGHLEMLIAQEGLRRALAEAGQRFMHAEFSREASARRMAAIYGGLLEGAA